MKGQIKSGHIGVNHYEFQVVGLIPITFTTISGLATETTAVELPDRTQASGGEEMVGEFTAELPMHHTNEAIALDAWLQESRDPVTPTYKKPVTIISKNIHGEAKMTHAVVGCWISKKETPELDMSNDGEMATLTYTFKYDAIARIG
jgi:hypothetical protein